MTLHLHHPKNILGMLTLICLGSHLLSCKKNAPFSFIKPEITVYGNDTRFQANTTHLSSDTVYVLGSSLVRDSGQDLAIDAGTLIKVNDGVAVIIRAGAAIHAKGTAAHPIIFTSSAAAGNGGIRADGNSNSDLHTWRGLQIFGSTNPSSEGAGILNYVRIEFAGAAGYGGSPPPYYGSLLLSNISRNTTVDHIQVSYSLMNPAFELVGGDCDAHYLVSYASSSSDFYLHGGYKGRLQNLLAYRHAFFPTSNTSFVGAVCGLYIEDDSTLPSISNLTVLGPDPAQISSQYNLTNNRAAFEFQATTGSKFHIRNSVLLGFPKTGWYLGDGRTAQGVADNSSDFRYSIIQSNDSSRAFYLAPGSYNPYNSHSFRNYLLQPLFHNQLFIRIADFQLTDPFNYDANPNPMPMPGSPVLTGANFEETPFSDPFFNKVSYVGALGTDNWLKDWTNFMPLRTRYNTR